MQLNACYVFSQYSNVTCNEANSVLLQTCYVYSRRENEAPRSPAALQGLHSQL